MQRQQPKEQTIVGCCRKWSDTSSKHNKTNKITYEPRDQSLATLPLLPSKTKPIEIQQLHSNVPHDEFECSHSTASSILTCSIFNFDYCDIWLELSPLPLHLLFHKYFHHILNKDSLVHPIVHPMSFEQSNI